MHENTKIVILIFKNSKGKSDWQWDHFDVSVPMSTYLIAYSINSFEYREAVVQMEDEVVFRIYARPDAIDQVISDPFFLLGFVQKEAKLNVIQSGGVCQIAGPESAQVL